MYNPIEEKRRLVQERISKSFDSGINLAEEIDLEKAWNVGDEKQYLGVTWYVGGFNAKGQPLWRKKKDGGDNTDKKASANATDAAVGSNSINAHKNVKDTDADWWNDAEKIKKHMNDPLIQKTMPQLMSKLAARYDELKKKQTEKSDLVSKVESKATDILKEAGINDVKKVAKVSTMGDVITISYINTSDVRVGVDFAKTGKVSGNVRGKHERESKIIAGIAETNGKTSKKKYSDMDIKDAKKALVGKVVTLKDYWPDGRGGSQDAIGEIKNVRLYGKDKLPIAEISYPNGDEQLIRLDEIDDGKMKDSYNTTIVVGDDKTHLDAVKKKIANSNSDPRDKIAQDAGFKDYEEMKGYQDYVTQKNLLKKKSTKSGMRLLYEQSVAKYEKDHADLIKRVKS